MPYTTSQSTPDELGPKEALAFIMSLAGVTGQDQSLDISEEESNQAQFLTGKSSTRLNRTTTE